MNPLQTIAQRYAQYFQSTATFIKAPGRFNLIGEHTDYNEGFVLPAAIDRHIYFALGKSKDTDQVAIFSPAFDAQISFSLNDDDLQSLPNWGRYFKAATQEMQSRDYDIIGVSGAVQGDIPLGAGLSSSAALCCGFIKGIAHLNDIELSKAEIASIAQKTEHRVGLNCGLMDQYAVLFGQKEQAVFLDCQSLEVKHVPLDLGDYRLLIFNSNIRHELAADSGYNERRAACERVVAHIAKDHASVQSLRDVGQSLLEQYASDLDATDLKRAQYVLDENERVVQAKAALAKGDLAQVGQLLNASHIGMRDEYEITVPEIDLLVDLAQAQQGVLGSRMTGGGFGGCTIALVHQEEREQVEKTVLEQYEAQTGQAATCYQFGIEDGVRIV
ncbi:MAG: galactokinase [Bacteroidota bacterium]